MNPLMNSVGSNAEGKLNCINAVVITQRITVILIQNGMTVILCKNHYFDNFLREESLN